MQINIGSWQIIFTFVPSLLILLAVFLAKIFFNINISVLMRDPAYIAGHSPLTGIVSNLGGIIWFCSATICLFSAVVLYGYKSKNIFVFFLCSGLLSLYLGLDDFFMFHEYLASRYLGIRENYILLSIGILVIAYLARFWKLVLSMEYRFFLLSLVFLCASVFIDVIPKSLVVSYGDWILLYEDGCKFLGIASWLSYFFGISYTIIRNSFLP